MNTQRAKKSPAKVAARKRTRNSASANIIYIERTGVEWDQREFDAMTFEQAESHVAKMNAENHGGNTKKRPWQLPTVEQLFVLADRSRYSHAANPAELPNCQSTFYWSRTQYVPDPAYRWGVYFDNGGTDIYDANYRARVRACRSSQ